MDAFALVLLIGVVAVVLMLWLLGRYYPGSGLEELGLRSPRQITEAREAAEAEDLDQMIAARNAMRRKRGQSEESADEIQQRVMSDVREQRRRREQYLADRDLDELLEATNARRRARGLPERTKADVQREFGPPPADD